MPEFLHLLPPSEALELLLGKLPESNLIEEIVYAEAALGRIVARDICAPHSLPEFQRSTVDGYAVCAKETFGVSESMPGYLELIGEVPMGSAPGFSLLPGSCSMIHTGGMLPTGADAVIMLEFSQNVRMNGNLSQRPEIEILRSVAIGENTLSVGEDIVKDQIIFYAGTRVRPAEIGGCMALGIIKIPVVKKPKIGILSSGDEVIAPGRHPKPGEVRDINSYSLAAMVTEAGGEPIRYGIIPDDLDAMKITSQHALHECDAVLITAGSSASTRDTTAEAISSLGTPGVLVHGINIRPGKPTILAICEGKPVIGLPGNPVSALVIAKLFVVPIIDKILGVRSKINSGLMAKLSVNVASQAGREDWVAVKVVHRDGDLDCPKLETEWLAEPIFGKSNLIFSLVAANGLFRIPPDVTGISAGEVVEVFLI